MQAFSAVKLLARGNDERDILCMCIYVRGTHVYVVAQKSVNRIVNVQLSHTNCIT
jgi:hypothetical protein